MSRGTAVSLTRYVCANCGTQHDASAAPPPLCRICSDGRQYVAWAGQQWTTHDELLGRHTARIEMDGELLGIGILPAFGIPQRALHVPTDAGNILWETTSLVTPAAVEALRERGGVDLIVISHPHFYASMVEWSDALGGVPILLHAADRDWVERSSPNIEFWEGASLQLSPDVTLHNCPGHFPGSTVLHRRGPAGGRSILLAGDALHVAQDRRHVAFMYSVPNHVPSHPDSVRLIRERLEGIEFDDLYGFTWGLNILGDARAAVDRSFERTLAAMGQPLVPSASPVG